MRPPEHSSLLAICFSLISKSPFQPLSSEGPVVLVWIAFTLLISLTCLSLHSQTFPALWPLCDAVKTSPKLHIWHGSRSILTCRHGDGGGRRGWRRAGCVRRGCVVACFRDVGQELLLVWTAQFTWSSSDVTDCGFLCPACLICHPAACVITPFLFGLSPLRLFP